MINYYSSQKVIKISMANTHGTTLTRLPTPRKKNARNASHPLRKNVKGQ